MNRRSFFQSVLISFGALGFISSISQAEEKRRAKAPTAGAGAQLVDPKDAQAKAVNYVHNNSEIKDKALQTERGGVKFKDQNCLNCVFYQKDKETTVSGKKAAPCQMPFASGKVVAEKGWCSSWAKKS